MYEYCTRPLRCLVFQWVLSGQSSKHLLPSSVPRLAFSASRRPRRDAPSLPSNPTGALSHPELIPEPEPLLTRRSGDPAIRRSGDGDDTERKRDESYATS